MLSPICERIRSIRKDYALNQVEFAKRLGITNAYVSKIEKGDAVPSAALTKLICKEFRINEEWLINGVEPIFIDDIEENVENLLTTTLEDINKLYLRTDNANLRYEFAKVENLFRLFVDSGFTDEQKKKDYLMNCEVVFRHILKALSLTRFSDGSQMQLVFDQNDINKLVDQEISEIRNAILTIYEMYKM